MAEKRNKKPARLSRRKENNNSQITADTPLTIAEQRFLTNYIKTSNLAEAVKLTPELQPENRTRNNCSQIGQNILRHPNVQAELRRVMEEARKETQATASEVMEYFTKVMRGEEKDQFGLDAPLSERTKAAQELAKRTIDIENRASGKADERIEIKLDWSR